MIVMTKIFQRLYIFYFYSSTGATTDISMQPLPKIEEGRHRHPSREEYDLVRSALRGSSTYNKVCSRVAFNIKTFFGSFLNFMCFMFYKISPQPVNLGFYYSVMIRIIWMTTILWTNWEIDMQKQDELATWWWWNTHHKPLMRSCIQIFLINTNVS